MIISFWKQLSLFNGNTTNAFFIKCFNSFTSLVENNECEAESHVLASEELLRLHRNYTVHMCQFINSWALIIYILFIIEYKILAL